MRLVFLIILISFVFLPSLVYFCIKFGTIAYYKAKQFIEKETEVKQEK